MRTTGRTTGHTQTEVARYRAVQTARLYTQPVEGSQHGQNRDYELKDGLGEPGHLFDPEGGRREIA